MHFKKKVLSIILTVLTISMASMAALCAPVTASAASAVGVTYKTQVQKLGWQKPVSNGTQAGTTGKSLRLEALTATLNNAPGATISYRVQVQHYGWMTHVTNGKVAGTVGKGLRMEAIKISIAGLPGYEIQYRAYVQRQGWDKSWKTVKNGTSLDSAPYAGTVGKSLRMEAIEIRIVKVGYSWTSGTSDDDTATYRVGTDLPAGEYVVCPTDSEYGGDIYESNDADQNDIVNQDSSMGRIIMTLESGKYVSYSGKMYKIADAPKVDFSSGVLTEGMYKVNTDIPAGKYTISPTLTEEYNGTFYYILKDSLNLDDSIIDGNYISGTETATVTLTAGQYIEFYNGKLTKAAN